ncbi:transposase-like protein [Demequina lutea]|uniref:Mutator family transposase n=1 Tax=Demequina lutea TaxID=431489 RepID=A0A7Y9Z7R0_9MICO|nr:transposase-like protein [Demequina lutea]
MRGVVVPSVRVWKLSKRRVRLDDLYAMIDAGKVRLDGSDGLIQQLIKAGLERGFQAELSEHLGYEKGDPEAGFYPNSRNGSSARTVATSVRDVDLAIPRDRQGSFTPALVPKGSRRVGGSGRHDRVAVCRRDDRA